MAHDDRPISKRLSEHDDRGAGADERRRDVAEAVVYLRSRRIEIPEDESPHGVVRLLSAVQQFENAVKERGGVVMIAGVTSRRTSKTRFMLPARRDDETVTAFAARVRTLAKRIASGA
jgi:hypothetical protein